MDIFKDTLPLSEMGLETHHEVLIPDEETESIKEKVIDIYNFLADKGANKMTLYFESGKKLELCFIASMTKENEEC